MSEGSMRELALHIPVRPTSDHAVELIPRRVLGSPTAGPLKKRISLGEPLLLPLAKPDAERAAVQDYLLREMSTHDFYELHLVVNLYPDPNEPFVTLGIGVSLDSQDQSDRPIAWSLFPVGSAFPVR